MGVTSRLWKVVRKKGHGDKTSCSSRHSCYGSILIPCDMEVYTYDDISSMTNDFSPDNLLGTSSSSSSVLFYKASFPAETRVRTIKLWKFDAASDWVARNACVTSLMDEIGFLGTSEASHASLPKMVGCCWDYNSLAAVYDIDPLATLHNALHQGCLDWSDRLHIAFECALLLQYLHGLQPCLLAHDFSVHNIILDQDKHPTYIVLDGMLLEKQTKDIDTGLTVHYEPHSSTASSSSSSVGSKSFDVHSFGVLLLAILDTKNCECTHMGKCDFNGKTWERIHKNKVWLYFCFRASVDLVDSKFKGHHKHNSYDTIRLSKLGLSCLTDCDHLRPTMDIVVEKFRSLFFFSINERGVLPLKGSSLGELTFDELSTITDNFSTDNLIGKTLFGSLYKGKIMEGWKGCKAQEVTVKILEKNKMRRSSHKDLVYKLKDEMSFLRHPKSFSHPCLPRLIGYCFENEQLGAVYKLKTVGTLKDFLSKDSFEWAHRIEMITHLASLLHFLHTFEPCYVVGNLSTCHMVIDEDMCPNLIDFGMITGGILGKKREQKHLSNIGSTGYIDATSIYVTGQWTPKIDIYAFGVFLIEILSKKHVLDGDKGCAKIIRKFEDDFVVYVKENNLSSDFVVDPTLKKQEGYNDNDAYDIVKLALHCVHIHPPTRPSAESISDVLARLKFFNDLN